MLDYHDIRDNVTIMTDLERAWLAGLLEGEGCFTISRPPNGPPIPVIQLAMTDLDIILRAAPLMGGRGQVRVQRAQKMTTKICYRWRVSGQKAIALMRMLYPLMGNRRQQRIQELLGLKDLP